MSLRFHADALLFAPVFAHQNIFKWKVDVYDNCVGIE
jgi:hypothetical protein